jgi:hypothetical protein
MAGAREPQPYCATNHTFKRYTGLSPNGYRASLRRR